MEKFKPLEALISPDERNLFWCITDVKSGASRPISLGDIYASISRVRLDDRVPEDIHRQFNVAKNVAVYSWYCYPFHQVCEMKAYATVEFALRHRLERNYPFAKLIKKAIAWGLIEGSGFSHVKPRAEKGAIEYSLSLVEIMPSLRNGLAHGGTTLHPGAVTTLSICADFINQLYRDEINKQRHLDASGADD